MVRRAKREGGEGKSGSDQVSEPEGGGPFEENGILDENKPPREELDGKNALECSSNQVVNSAVPVLPSSNFEYHQHHVTQKINFRFPAYMLEYMYNPSNPGVSPAGQPFFLGSSMFESADGRKWRTYLTINHWDGPVRWISVYYKLVEGPSENIATRCDFSITDKLGKKMYSRATPIGPVLDGPMGFTNFVPFIESLKWFDDRTLYLETEIMALLPEQRNVNTKRTSTIEVTQPQAGGASLETSAEPEVTLDATIVCIDTDTIQEGKTMLMFHNQAVVQVDTCSLERESGIYSKCKAHGIIEDSSKYAFSTGSPKIIRNFGDFVQSGENCEILQSRTSSVPELFDLLEFACDQETYRLATYCMLQLAVSIEAEYAGQFLKALNKHGKFVPLDKEAEWTIKEKIRGMYKEMRKQTYFKQVMEDTQLSALLVDIVFSAP